MKYDWKRGGSPSNVPTLKSAGDRTRIHRQIWGHNVSWHFGASTTYSESREFALFYRWFAGKANGGARLFCTHAPLICWKAKGGARLLYTQHQKPKKRSVRTAIRSYWTYFVHILVGGPAGDTKSYGVDSWEHLPESGRVYFMSRSRTGGIDSCPNPASHILLIRASSNERKADLH